MCFHAVSTKSFMLNHHAGMHPSLSSLNSLPPNRHRRNDDDDVTKPSSTVLTCPSRLSSEFEWDNDLVATSFEPENVQLSDIINNNKSLLQEEQKDAVRFVRDDNKHEVLRAAFKEDHKSLITTVITTSHETHFQTTLASSSPTQHHSAQPNIISNPTSLLLSFSSSLQQPEPMQVSMMTNSSNFNNN